MSNKRSEDFSVRIPLSELDENESNEKEGFIAQPAAGRPSRLGGAGILSGSGGGSGGVASLAGSLSMLENSHGLSILAYCLSSISMMLVNKYVVSGRAWNLNFFYLAVQSIVCILALTLLKNLGVMRNMKPWDSRKAKKWFPVSVLLVSMIYTSTKALQFLSVPVYTIFKNLTTIVIAYGEVLRYGGSVSPLTLLSFGLMVLSSVVAAWADIQSALNGDMGNPDQTAEALSMLNAGYAWMGMNVICTAAYVLNMRKVIKFLNFSDSDTMYYNNLLTIPVLVVCSLLAENWSSDNMHLNFPAESRNSLFVGMIYSGLAAIFISYCSAWCIRVTSSTTYSMVGALNKLPIAIFGLIFFSAPITFGSVSAIFLGVVSGLVYAWANIRQSRANKDRILLPTTQPVMSASSQSNRDVSR